MIKDAVILGAGAAGLMCAMTAGRRGFSCAVIDHSPVAGRKVRLAGGGKGNVTNKFISAEWYVGSQPNFPEALLKRCSTAFVLRMLETFGIDWEERDYGQIFCTVQAARLVESLMQTCRDAGTAFLFNAEFGDITYENGMFHVSTSKGDVHAPRLVIATGSPAWPACGATDAGMRLARQWGHKVIPVRPALVPLIFPESWPLHGLSGISLTAAVSAGGRTFRYPLLFTHKGMSGPGILQASCFWKPGSSLSIDFLPEHSALELMHLPEHGKNTVLGLFRRFLPSRLAERLVPETLASKKVAQLSKKERESVNAALHAHSVQPIRSEGMGHAEAAAGGVDTADVNPRTLESRKQPGLYFAGEVLDVTGLLGGYNLHWAWASGKAVGESWKAKPLDSPC